jgi:hypothetical protein
VDVDTTAEATMPLSEEDASRVQAWRDRVNALCEKHAVSSFGNLNMTFALCVAEVVMTEGLNPGNVADYIDRQIKEFEEHLERFPNPKEVPKKRRRPRA